MARVKGKDIIVDLIETVGELRLESARQRAAVETLLNGYHRQEGLFGRVGKLLGQMAENTAHRFEELEARMERLEEAAD